MDNQLERIYSEHDPGEDHLPQELLHDPHHPRSDSFEQNVIGIQRAILAQRNQMKPKMREAIQLHHSGLPATKIAERIKVTAPTVGKYINSDKGQRLLALFNHLQAKLDGPTSDHRKGILYRIAVDNEKERPNIAVTAIQEINKMSGAYEQSGDGNAINITINNELLPSGKLDELPPVHVIEGTATQIEDDTE